MSKLVAEPYSTGTAGKLEKATLAAAGLGAVTLAAAELRASKRLGRSGSALALASSMLGRWMVFKAGFQSAAAPQYTVGPQRQRIERGVGSP
jgi:hypothetical protein